MSIEVKENKIILKEHLKLLSMMYLMPIQIHRYLSNGFILKALRQKYIVLILKKAEAFFAIETLEQTSYTLTEYRKVDRPKYLEYFDYFATPKGEKDTRLPGMHISINFNSDNKQMTTVTSTSVFPTKEVAQQAVDMGIEAGMNSTLDQLEALLNE